MKFRAFISALIGVVVVLLLIGAGGFSWLAAHNPLQLLQGSGRSSPAAAIFIPRQAPAMVSLLVKPEKLEAFQLAVTTLRDRERVQTELINLRENLLTGTGLDYAQDVEPWLGSEITLAVTTADIDRDAVNGVQPGYLLAIATEDPERSREFLQLFWQKRAIAGVDLVFEQYAGVKLIYGKPKISANEADAALYPTLTSAVVGDRFVLFANYPKVLRDAITNVQAPDLNLNRSSGYQQALNSLPDRNIGLAYANLPQLTAWLGSPAPDVTDLAAAPLYDGLVMAFQLERQGILADTALLAAPGQQLDRHKPALSSLASTSRFIPTDTSLVALGLDLNQLWQQVTTGLKGYDPIATLVQQPLTDLRDRIQVDLPDDVFQVVTGEYALAALPRADKTQPDWVFVTQQSADLQAAIAHLDEVAQQQGMSTGTLSLGSREVKAWTKLSTANQRSKRGAIALQADLQGVHTEVDGYEIFATSVDAMDRVLQSAQTSVVSSPEFRQAIAPLPPQNDGYLYIDWSTVQPWVEQRFPITRLVEVAGQPLFNHLRSLSITSYGSESNLRRGTIFLRLKA